MRALSLGLLACLAACKSSGSEPTDPIAIEYCAMCSDDDSCERVVNDALMASCPEETGDYYTCLTDNACDDTACTEEWNERNVCMGRAPKDLVNTRILVLALASGSANFGRRGTGPTREGHPYPENSIPSFTAAIDQGANGVQLDAEVTSDERIIVMHDDTLDRTTDCTGCVSTMTFEQIRDCRLKDGDGNPTTLRPPTLKEVYDALGSNALINIELKVFGDDCVTETTGADALVEAALEEVIQIGAEDRTLLSSSDETAVELVKTLQRGFYCGLISENPDAAFVERAIELRQDAIHPHFSISQEDVQPALDAGLQVNVFGANDADLMQEQIDKGSTAIITDEPAIMAEVQSQQPEPEPQP
jgi:glycerophosphoryl diester phosphodiesterase